MSRTIAYDSQGNDITCIRVFDALLHPCKECDITDCEGREEAYEGTNGKENVKSEGIHMYEKISESHIREERISNLKKKILTEINEYFTRNRHYMREHLNGNQHTIKEWELMITREFALLRLKDYIEASETFWHFEAMYNDKDVIVYQVSEKNLNIWLQKEYNFTQHFLNIIEHGGICKIYKTLNDRYFGYQFTDIFDEIMYDRKFNAETHVTN